MGLVTEHEGNVIYIQSPHNSIILYCTCTVCCSTSSPLNIECRWFIRHGGTVGASLSPPSPHSILSTSTTSPPPRVGGESSGIRERRVGWLIS